MGWFWKLYNMASEWSGTGKWRPAGIAPLHKSGEERTVEVWLEKSMRVYQYTTYTEGLTDDVHRGFRPAKGCVHQNFTLKLLGEKEREKQ